MLQVKILNRVLLFCIIFMFSYTLCRAQNITIPYNSYDEEGKKHGYWETFVDSNFNKTENKSQAAWFFYSLYYHGELMIGYKYELDKLSGNRDNIRILSKPKYEIKSDILPLNDTLIWKWDKGRPAKIKTIFKEGHIYSTLMIWGDSEESWIKYYFDQKYKNNVFSFYLVTPDGFGKKIKKWYYYFDPNKKDVQKSKVEKKRVESARYFDILENNDL